MTTEIGGVYCERLPNRPGYLPDQIAWLCKWEDRMTVIRALIGDPPLRHPDRSEMFCQSISMRSSGPMRRDGEKVSWPYALILAAYSDKPLTPGSSA